MRARATGKAPRKRAGGISPRNLLMRMHTHTMHTPSSEVRVLRAQDPMLDAWRGAQQWASRLSHKHGGLGKVSVSKAEYEEKGSDYLKEHDRSNRYYPNP